MDVPMMVSIVVPTLGRPEKLERLLQSISKYAGYESYEVIVLQDSFENRQGVPKLLKQGVEQAKGEFVMYLGNDCAGEHNFLLNAVVKMLQSFPERDGLVALNDGIYNGTKATHWLAAKKLLPLIGGEFFCTEYEHCFCDQELTTKAQALEKYIYAPDARIFHDNAMNLGGEQDEVLKIAYDKDRYARDEATFRRREKNFPMPYPYTLASIDLRKKFEGLDIENLKVLNVGIGSMLSGIARQLFHWKFKRLDHVEIHEPYIEEAKRKVWQAQEVNYIHKKLQDVDNFGDYDLVLIFDVLEHLVKEESLAVLDKIKASGAKLLVFGPLEKEFRPNEFGAESQDHLSLWTEDDFKAKGYSTALLADFHKENGKAWDAVWASNFLTFVNRPAKISAALIVRNEEPRLEACLQSLKGVDEIVVVDTGSTDKTKEIAAKFTDKIYDFQWIDDFAAARNFALSKCTQDWVLSIDADEVLEEKGLEKIRWIVSKNELKTLNVKMISKVSNQVNYFPRVFKRVPEIFWQGALHETPSIMEGFSCDATITYDRSESHSHDPDRNLRILLKAVKSNPDVPRNLFYLAREYWDRRDLIVAVYWYEEYLKKSTWKAEIADAHLMLARCYWYLMKGEIARDHCLQAIKYNPNFKEAFLVMAEMTYPETARRWKEMATTANNEGVIFIRVGDAK